MIRPATTWHFAGKMQLTLFVTLKYFLINTQVFLSLAYRDNTTEYESNFTQTFGNYTDLYIGGPYKFTCEAGTPVGGQLPTAIQIIYDISAPLEVSNATEGYFGCFAVRMSTLSSGFESHYMFEEFFDIEVDTSICADWLEHGKGFMLEGNITYAMSEYLTNYACEVWPSDNDDKFHGEYFNWLTPLKQIPHDLKMAFPGVVMEGYPLSVRCTSEGGSPAGRYVYGKCDGTFGSHC